MNRIDIIPAIISKYPPNSAQIMAFLAVADLIRSPLPLAGKSTAHLIFALFDLDQAMILTPNGQLEILQRVAENRAEILPRFDPFLTHHVTVGEQYNQRINDDQYLRDLQDGHISESE